MELAEALPDDEIIALARGEIYKTPEEKKQEEIFRKECRESLGYTEKEEEELDEIDRVLIDLARSNW